MRKLTKITAVVLLFSFALIFSAGAEDATILKTKCTSCHEVDIIREHKRTVAEWEEIVARMAGHAEGELTRVDQLTVLKYLKQHLLVDITE